jgi:hypothetical protein
MPDPKLRSDRADLKRVSALIKIEETCMLYRSSPADGLKLIEEIIDKALDGER